MRSLILDTVTRATFPTVWVFSLYLLLTGHNAPGGGFIGGLVAAAALVLRYVSRGSEDVRIVMPLPFEALLAAGLLLAGGTGAAAWLAGGQFLESASFEFALPLFGHIKLFTVLFFDIGVYLIVVGLVLGALVTLGGERSQ